MLNVGSNYTTTTTTTTTTSEQQGVTSPQNGYSNPAASSSGQENQLASDIEKLLSDASGQGMGGMQQALEQALGGAQQPPMQGMQQPAMLGMQQPPMEGMQQQPMQGMQSPMMQGTPTQSTTSMPSGNNLTQIGSALQQGGAQQAMADFKNNDPAAFESFQASLAKGDGNSAAKTLAQAISSGKLSQADGAAIGAQLQQTANANGGGKINGQASGALSSALNGQNVLTQGHERSVGQVLSQAFS